MRPDSAFTAGPVVPVPAGATCPRHAGSAAIAACRRCGTFVCIDDRVSLDGSDFCRECAARPDVDYLEAFRLKYWGKRDSWAWFFGVTAVVNVIIGLTVIANAFSNELTVPNVALGIVILVWAGLAGAFWAGVKAARWGLVGAFALYAVALIAAAGIAGVGGIIFPLAFVASALGSVRTKLFFKMDVPREQLRKTWALLHDNVLARNAMTLGFAGMLFPPFAPMALVLGIVGLRRVDPNAYPPIGRRAHAITGIVLGALGTLVWSAVLVAIRLGKL